jgi:hypothetical protein
MTRESVFVHVSGAPFGIPAGAREQYLGPYTHMRSEGTWLLGVALNMARHGHPTTILAYPWGDQFDYPLPENVSLQKDFVGKCDIFIDCGWDDRYALDRFKDVKAGFYVHGWGGDPAGSSFLNWQKKTGAKNHFMARTSRCFQKQFREFPFSVYMPTPLCEKVKRNSNFKSRRMLWANRGAYNESYAQYSDQLLAFMERHPEYYYEVLLYVDIMQKAKQLGRLEEVDYRFRHLPNRDLSFPYWGIPHNQFLNELSESKVLLANGCPSAHPQTLEAVCMGCVPVLWSHAENHFQNHFGYSYNLHYGVDGPNEAFDLMLEDFDAWETYYTLLTDAAKDHEYDNAYSIFKEELLEKDLTC